MTEQVASTITARLKFGCDFIAGKQRCRTKISGNDNKNIGVLVIELCKYQQICLNIKMIDSASDNAQIKSDINIATKGSTTIHTIINAKVLAIFCLVLRDTMVACGAVFTFSFSFSFSFSVSIIEYLYTNRHSIVVKLF